MLSIEQYLNKVKPFIEKDLKTTLNELLNKKSDLSKDLSVTSSNSGLEIQLSDYIKYIESGRKAKTKRIPITVLSKWGKKAGLGTLSNNELYAIQTSIFNKGIAGRPNLIKKFGERVEDLFENLYERVLSPQYEQDLDELITKKLLDNGFRHK